MRKRQADKLTKIVFFLDKIKPAGTFTIKKNINS